MLNLDAYRPIVEFLAIFLGAESEITLCDTEQILMIENSMDETRHVGSPLSEMQQALLKNPKCRNLPYNINYRTLSNKGEKMRSATLFIREGQTVVGLLTINHNVAELVRIRSYLNTLISGDQGHNILQSDKKSNKPMQSYETLTFSVTEMIDKVLEEASIRFNAAPGRLKADEKRSIIREMDSRGVFLAKGSVMEVARKLQSSKATIYRYLHQLGN